MAQVINRSDASVEVFGSDPAGALLRMALRPGDQTTTAFNALEVRANDGAQILGDDRWQSIHTDQAFVYSIKSGWFTDDLSLHCVPFKLDPNNVTHWRPGNERAPDNAARDALPLTDGRQAAPPLVEPSAYPAIPSDPARRTSEGELTEIDGAEFAFGRQVRTRVGTKIYISVRLAAQVYEGLSRAEASRLNDRDGAQRTQFDRWKLKIEQTWNQTSMPAASSGETFAFEVQWVDESSHYDVDIHPTGPSLLARATMYWWPVSLDDDLHGSRGQDFWPVSAHEFGHYLGLRDGYLYPQELPTLAQSQTIQTLLLNSAVGPRVIREGTGSFYALFSSRLSEGRAKERLAGGACPVANDLMNDEHRIVGGVPAPLVTAHVLDALLARKEQGLCYREQQFTSHPSWLTTP